MLPWRGDTVVCRLFFCGVPAPGGMLSGHIELPLKHYSSICSLWARVSVLPEDHIPSSVPQMQGWSCLLVVSSPLWGGHQKMLWSVQSGESISCFSSINWNRAMAQALQTQEGMAQW